MREIRFRVWDEKEMIYPSLYWFEENGVTEWPGDGFWASKDTQIMQYTGLHDAAGKRIYEGDIIATLDGCDSAVVVWDESCAAFAYDPADDPDNGGFLYELYPDTARIVGNKFEHPELLQTKENDSDECE